MPQAALVLITRNLPPLCGGMERLNEFLARAMAELGSLCVIGPEGCGAVLPGRTTVIEVPHGPLRRFFPAAYRALARVAREPVDLAVAGSGLTVPLARVLARRTGCKTAAYLHGLDLVVAHRLYQALWPRSMRRLDMALANSANTARLAEQRGVAGGALRVVHPPVALRAQIPDGADRFRRRFGLGDRPVLLSVGRLTERKGLDVFVARALGAIVEGQPETVLVVIGEQADDALNKGRRDARRRLEGRVREHGLGDHVLFLGPCDDVVLGQAYQAADVHVFPVRDLPGDVEGFGMVAIEAAAHGTPTVAFAVGGVADAVADGLSGRLLPADDYGGFAAAVRGLLDERLSSYRAEQCRQFAKGFAWPVFRDRVVGAFGELIGQAGRA